MTAVITVSRPGPVGRALSRMADMVPAVGRFLLLLALFSLFARSAAQGAWVEAGALVGMVVFAVVVAYGRWWLLVGWVVATPTVLVLVNNAMMQVPVVNGPRLLFGSLLAVVATTVLLRRGRAAPPGGPEILMLMMVPFLIVSAILALDCAGAGTPAEPTFALMLDAFIMPYFAYWAARQVAWTDARVRLLLGLLMAAGAYVALAGLSQYFLGVDAFSPRHVINEIHTSRARGPFPNAVEFGAVMLVFAIMAIFQVMVARGTPQRMVVVALGAVFLVGVVLSLTRSVWLAVPVVLLWLAIADRRMRPVLIPLLVAGGLVTALALPFILQYGPVAERLTDVVPIYNRATVYMTALSMGLDNPLSGVGFGRYCFQANSVAYAQPFLGIPAEFIVGVGVPHNEFLHMFALTGLPGVFLYVLIYGAVFRACGRARRAPETRETLQGRIGPYAQAAMVVVLVNAMLVDLIYFSSLLLLTFFLAGVATAPRSGGLLAPLTENAAHVRRPA